MARSYKIMKDLDAPVIGIRNENSVLAIDEDSRRQLKLSSTGAMDSERIQQLPLLIKNLHYIGGCVRDIKMSFGIESHSLRARQADILAHGAEGGLVPSGPIEKLDASIEGIDNRDVISLQVDFGRQIEFARTIAALAEAPQHVALHIKS